MKLRVVLADDHPFVLLGVRSALEAAGDMQIVGEATGPRELFRLLENVPCDVVLTDLTMPGEPGEAEDGLHLVRRLRRDWPQLRIVVLTSIANVAILRAVMNTGVTALIRKSEPMEELTAAVRGAGNGLRYVSRSILDELAAAGTERADSTRVPRLSPRESEVVRQFVLGRTITEIARSLDRDVRTVSRQKRDAMAKLGVSNDAGLFAFVRANGLL
ncbi:response regulator transcription factor [Paraburkholderia sp. Ac-20340]|uniref:response regulator transcription factor n=1 Tax=Paraburkholderia sp. Ac-20340 TaxID=2703888 RepID=UPI00197DC96A|nr:response regulator transcription factor [Paraburkholderia sp. Ac-20340]MBN3855302.1 response regulator transcription factor [Paraburkholderia sp. Ac-20340]